MTKILVVDDNQNNRMLLEAILEDYQEQNKDIQFTIREASNGVEAVVLAEDEHYDLIFMDIMMPEMDGITATYRIRQSNPKTMIVAVSAVDDAARQKEILQNGAEDYIAKPVNADIFHTRLNNYIKLIDSRNHPKKLISRMTSNLYTNEVFSRKVTFYIGNDDELAEFWEYYLLNTENGCELLSDTIRTMYAFGSIALKIGMETEVIVEENETYSFFTMNGFDKIDPKIVKLVLLKTPGLSEYKIENDRFSVSIEKQQYSHKKIEVDAPLKASPASTSSVVESVAASVTPVQIEAAPIEITKSASEVHVFNYMDPDDLEEVKEFISKLESLLLLVGRGDIHMEEVQEIAAYLEKIGRMLKVYSDAYVIGTALSGLSEDIRSHVDAFIQKSVSLGTMCSAFSRDMMTWVRMIFEEGAPSVNYMDDTIVSNAQMIGSVLKMDDQLNSDDTGLDDIFDF